MDDKTKGLGEDCSSGSSGKGRSRVAHRKVHGGCVTCKARRVKCDETKPSCLRCLKFWGYCDGYAKPKKRAGKTQVPEIIWNSRPLLPHFSGSSPIQDALITTTPFRTEYEHQGFQNFVTQTVPQLPGLFSTSLWDKVILQASASEPFVRDTLSAIGALSSCGRKWAQNLPAGQKVTHGFQVTPQYRFALQQYGNAVNSMRKKLASYADRKEAKDHNLRIALISCLLVICFEGLQGNYFLALQHASSGHSILHEWLSSQPKQKSTSSSTATTGLGSPAPNIIEDSLIQTFSRLDLQIMSYVDTRPPSLHSALKSEGTSTIQSMPTIFTSIAETRLYWELIQRRTSHFIAFSAASAATKDSLRKDKDMEIDMGLGSGSISVTPESEVRLSQLSPSLQSSYLSYASEIDSWFMAFTPFYLTLEKKTRTWTAASILKIQAISHKILFHSAILSDEWSLDSFLPEFRIIVELGKEISEDPFFKKEHVFTFDMGIVNPIRLVSKWCREPKLRRESLGLLRKVAVREGVWDALTMASVSEWMMEVEEERMVDGVIRKEDRVKICGIVMDNLKRMAMVKCERLGRRPDGSVDVRETVIRW